MITAKLALRNLTRQKKRSLLIGGALAFGILVLTMSNGVLSGLLRNVQQNWSTLNGGQIFVSEMSWSDHNQSYFSIDDDRALVAAVRKEGVADGQTSRRTVQESGATLIFNTDSTTRGLLGIDWTAEPTMGQQFEFVAGSADGMAGSDGLILGLSAAEKLNLVSPALPDVKTQKQWRKLSEPERTARLEAWTRNRNQQLKDAIGERIIVQLSTIHGQQNVGEFRLKGIFSGQFDVYAYTDRTVLNRLLALPDNGYNRFSILVSEYGSVTELASRLHAVLSLSYPMVPLERTSGKMFDDIINDLKKGPHQGAKMILSTVENEFARLGLIFGIIKLVSFLFVILLLLVIMVGIANTYRIVVFERMKEIGTMRSLGMQKGAVTRLFLFEALFLSLAGVGVGFLVGCLCLALASLGQVHVVAELALFLDRGHLNPYVEPSLFFATTAVTIALTVAAAFVPASRAARLDPALAIRTQY